MQYITIDALRRSSLSIDDFCRILRRLKKDAYMGGTISFRRILKKCGFSLTLKALWAVRNCEVVEFILEELKQKGLDLDELALPFKDSLLSLETYTDLGESKFIAEALDHSLSCTPETEEEQVLQDLVEYLANDDIQGALFILTFFKKQDGFTEEHKKIKDRLKDKFCTKNLDKV